MKLIERICKDIESNISDKQVMEIACGEASFSVESSKYAKKVIGTDISLERSKKVEILPDNLEFVALDASSVHLYDGEIDTIVCFNGLGHMKSVLENVLLSCMSKFEKGGDLIFISTWKLDIGVNDDVLIPLIKKHQFDYMVKNTPKYTLTHLKKR